MVARTVVVCLVIAVVAWMTGGCARQQETPDTSVAVAPPTDTSPEPKDADEEPSAEPSDDSAGVDGEALKNEKCTKCHDLARVKAHDPAEESWAEIVEEMQGKKDGWISDDEAEAILAHLEVTYTGDGA